MQYIISVFLAMIFLGFNISKSETIYVNVHKGQDGNPGTSDLPVKSIMKAVEILNNSNDKIYSSIKIAPGLYTIDKECIINNNNPYTEKNRLSIEAQILPDDKNWTSESMPIIISTQSPDIDTSKKLTEISGLEVEVDHVTIRGLKFPGTPLPKVFYYPIYRKGKSLEDLVVSQCMFICDPQVAAANVGVIANGHGLKIDHCVFYGCANAVVFWDAEGGISRNNAMTHCLIDGGYVSGVWLCQTGEDFEFSHNIITNSSYAFMRNETNLKRYTISDCIITGNKHFSGKSTLQFELSETGREITYLENNIIRKGDIYLEKCTGLDLGISKDYLQIVKGTPGYEFSAGIFTK